MAVHICNLSTWGGGWRQVDQEFESRLGYLASRLTTTRQKKQGTAMWEKKRWQRVKNHQDDVTQIHAEELA